MYAGIILNIFLTTPVAAKFGLVAVGTFNIILFIPPLIHKLSFDTQRVFNKDFLPELRVILVGAFAAAVKLSLGDPILMKDALFLIIIPMLVSIVLSLQTQESRKVIQYILLLFFFTECGLAIYERIVGINLFPYDDPELAAAYSFRSTSLYGQPLTNALVVSIIMGYVVISDPRPMIRGAAFLFGMVAILCFNARAASLIWIMTSLILFFKMVKENGTGKHGPILVLGLGAAAVYLFYVLIVEQGFGDRLLSDDIIDGSAQTRFDVFKAFSFFDDAEILFGHSSFYMMAMGKLEAGGVENSYITIILNYGLIVFCLLAVVYFFWLKKYFGNLPFTKKWIILLSFLGVGSSNNALALSIPWMVFIISANAYAPHLVNKIKKRPSSLRRQAASLS